MRLPALFIGHGSPMNALGESSYSKWLGKLGQELPKPKSILVISAHWESPETQVLNLAAPPTIHDFFGFPPELYQIRYPAPGAPKLAEQVASLLGVKTSSQWGLDHGTWSVLRHLYPAADIPVTQLSISTELEFSEHFELAKKLQPLRDEGVLILGSGNVVHNLREFSFSSVAPIMPWATDFDQWVEKALSARDFTALTQFTGLDEQQVRRAITSGEHYVPLLYVLGAALESDLITCPFTEIQNGSISMRSVRAG